MDLVDHQFGGLLKALAARVVERVGHEHADRVGRGARARENVFAADDRVTDGGDEIFVDGEFFFLGDERVAGEAGDELGGIVGAGDELGVEHALDQRGRIFGDLLEKHEILVVKLALGAGGRLFVENLDGADHDVARLERDGEHGANLEAGRLRHRHHHRRLRLGVAEKNGFSVVDDLADDALAERQLEREELVGVFLEVGGLGLVVAPEGGRVVNVTENDVVTLDQIEGHRLGLEGFHDLRRGELDDGGDILAARGRLRDDLDQEGAAEGVGESGR